MKRAKLWLTVGAISLVSLFVMAQSAFACSWGFGEEKVPESMIR